MTDREKIYLPSLYQQHMCEKGEEGCWALVSLQRFKSTIPSFPGVSRMWAGRSTSLGNEEGKKSPDSVAVGSGYSPGEVEA